MKQFIWNYLQYCQQTTEAWDNAAPLNVAAYFQYEKNNDFFLQLLRIMYNFWCRGCEMAFKISLIT